MATKRKDSGRSAWVESRTAVWIPRDDHSRIKQQAQEAGLSLGAFISEATAAYKPSRKAERAK